MMGHCGGCAYWSETCAQALGGRPLEALCENANSPKAGRFTTASNGCGAFSRQRAASPTPKAEAHGGATNEAEGCE